MRMVAAIAGGGLLTLLILGVMKAAVGGIVGVLLFLAGLALKIVLAAVLVWLAVKMLKTLVKPSKQEA